MKRREFIAGLGSAAGWPVGARAQQAAVIGWLSAVPGTMEAFYLRSARVSPAL